MVESLLLSAARITTFADSGNVTNASGFFFKRDDRLYLVSSRHVFIDQPSGHFPHSFNIVLHVDENNLAESIDYSIPLYRDGLSLWKQVTDTAGEVDVAVIEIQHEHLPANALYRAFTPDHINDAMGEVEIGTNLLVVGFPLGFHDTLHHLPVVRQGVNASSFAFRFQGMGYFLTDARTHRGISGACVVKRSENELGGLPWSLLGVHSARMDIGTRDTELDEALGLNCAWFADVLLALTAE